MKYPSDQERQDYFDLADEIWETIRVGADQGEPSAVENGCTLTEMEPTIVASVAISCANYGWPWPPDLPWAEEDALNRIRSSK